MPLVMVRHKKTVCGLGVMYAPVRRSDVRVLFIAVLVLGCGDTGGDSDANANADTMGDSATVPTPDTDTAVDTDPVPTTDTDTFVETDTATDTDDTGTQADTDGTYRSTDLELTAEIMGASAKCSGGEIVLAVSGSDKPQVTGALLCSFTEGVMVGIDVQATLEGALTPTVYEVVGTLTGDAAGYPLEDGIWSGSFSGSTLTATLEGTADLDGFELVLAGGFTATLETP